MREIKVELRNFEEIKIGERVYKLDLSNEALERYRTQFQTIQYKLNEMTSSSTLNINTIMETLKEVINGMYLDAPFDSMSAEFGGNVLALTKIFIQSVEAFKDIMKIR